MENEPDLRFDIDALFAHLSNLNGEEASEPKEWWFALSAPEVSTLEKVAELLADEFTLHLQEEVHIEDSDGNTSPTDPELIIVETGVFSLEEIKALAQRFENLATEYGLRYDGVDCFDAVDEQELYGWINPEDAGWRLRSMTDSGLEEDADLPWAFLIATPSTAATNFIGGALAAEGFIDREEYDEPDEDGNYGMCVFVAGSNNETELNATAEKITEIAQPFGGSLEGIQFYTRDEVAEIFGEDEEESEEDDEDPIF